MLKKLILLCTIFAYSLSSSFTLAEEEHDPLAVKQIQLFSEVFHQIKQHYVDAIDDETLMQHAISGMLNQLDPHSTWLTQQAYADLQEMTEGEFAGIGIEVIPDGDYLRVVTPIDGSPAQQAGIMANDRITAIDKQSLKGKLYSDSIELLRGEEGSLVKLQILREDEKKPLSFKLKRRMIKVDSVKSELYEQHIAYLRIAQFQKDSAKEAAKHLQQLEKKSEEALAGIILDLRNNPGGMLRSAVAMVDMFIPQGLIVYTEGQIKDQRQQYYASGKAEYTQLPLLIIINQGSASASEIVAGALQDHQRALIIGENSFGKGSVQTVIPLPDKQAIKMTTAHYYTPLGRSIQAKGIKPDITISTTTQTATDKQQSQDKAISEALKLIQAMQFGQRVKL